MYRVLLGTLAVLLTSCPVLATTYRIDPFGTGDYPDIQSAVMAASGGDTLALEDGTYTGPNNRNIDFGGKSLVVESVSGSPESCTIDCEHSSRAFYFHSYEDAGAQVVGIRVRSGSETTYGGAIFIQGYCTPVIRNCIFEANVADYAGGAIAALEYAAPLIEDCIFSHNLSKLPESGHGGGIHCGHESSVTIRGCTFDGNEASLRGGGLHCHLHSNVLMENCTFHDNFSPNGACVGARYNAFVLGIHCILSFGRASYAAHAEVSSTIRLSTTDVFGNEGGDWVQAIEGQDELRGNISADPLYCEPENGNFQLASTSPCAFQRDIRHGIMGAWPIGCETPIEIHSMLAAAQPPASRILAISPNPITSEAAIQFSVGPQDVGGEVTLCIFDIAGRCLRTLRPAAIREGVQRHVWNRRGSQGQWMPRGIYFLRLTVQGRSRDSRSVMVQ